MDNPTEHLYDLSTYKEPNFEESPIDFEEYFAMWLMKLLCGFERVGVDFSETCV